MAFVFIFLSSILVVRVWLRRYWRNQQSRPVHKALRIERRRAAQDEGGKAMKGVIAGSVSAAILLPLISGLALAFQVQMFGSSLMSDRLASAIGVYVFGFIPGVLLWAFFIIAIVPLWTVLCRRGNPGPRAAALLGSLIGVPAGWYMAGVISVHGNEQRIAIVSFVLAGAGGGAMTWLRAYRPTALWRRLRLCPIFGRCEAEVV